LFCSGACLISSVVYLLLFVELEQKMDERRKRSVSIEEFLERDDVRDRVQKQMKEARAAATVTIGRAAKLFGFSENQLRDWEKRGWLNPQRPDNDSSSEQDSKKHRQYAPGELDRLAAIRVLMDSDYSPAEINQGIDQIRYIADLLSQPPAVLPESGEQLTHSVTSAQGKVAAQIPIDQYIDKADEELFWRFYAASALRLSLMLLHKDNPQTIISIMLPIESRLSPSVSTANIAELGSCLIGWLEQGLSFYLLYDVPSFEHYTDFRLHSLQVMKNGVVHEDALSESTQIVVQRRALPLNISASILTTIRRLLTPLYQRKNEWLPLFTRGQRSFSIPAIDFNRGLFNDAILPKLADLVVSMGNDKGWRFACILTPHDPQLPVSQHKLVIRAKSENAPEDYKIGTTLVSPLDEVISVSLRAYQGGRICYRHLVVPEDKSVAKYDWEKPIGSALAIPIGGEDATPLGVIYLASREPDAFDENDQRVLRIAARMVQEILLTYQTRLHVAAKLTPLIDSPALADLTFAPFLSETAFITDLEKLLCAIREREDLEAPLRAILELEEQKQQRKAFLKYFSTNDVLSFICIDINDQTSLAQKYGERMTRNLSREVGRRIEEKLLNSFPNRFDCKLYQAYDDRYYILLPGIPLEEACSKSWGFKDALDGTYQIDALRFSTDQRTPWEMLVQENITVRLGVVCYPSIKLYELMQRPQAAPHPPEFITATIRMDLDNILKMVQGEERAICSWDPENWAYRIIFEGEK
jgi:DNA-binding transcriptional MerR regulator